MKILAVDFGEARTGVAISDAAGIIAMPLTVIHERKLTPLLERIAQIAKENDAGEIVAGNPINMNGTRGEKSAKCEYYAQKLREILHGISGEHAEIPVVLWDERLSTAHAYAVINTDNRKGKKRRENIDAVAASLILESYLGAKKNIM
jgi:putative Holliday junction resolvase